MKLLRIFLFCLLSVSMLIVGSHTILADDEDVFIVHSSPKNIKAVAFIDDAGAGKATDIYKGKVVLLNYWATWCPPCVREMPALSTLQKKYADKGLVVVTISEDWAGTQAKTSEVVKRFFERNKIDNLPAYLDADENGSDSLGVDGLPTSILLDGDGREIGRISGELDTSDSGFRKILTKALGR